MQYQVGSGIFLQGYLIFLSKDFGNFDGQQKTGHYRVGVPKTLPRRSLVRMIRKIRGYG